MKERTRRLSLEAHPLVVAAALGLLGPAALAFEEEEEESAPCAGCPESAVAQEWEPGPAPDPEEFHRVELEWLKST
jgi:hypothetical protein